LLRASGTPHLRIDVTSAVFHAHANMLVIKEFFTMWVTVGSVAGILGMYMYFVHSWSLVRW